MSTLLIKNAKVVLPGRVTDAENVLIEDGKIAKIGFVDGGISFLTIDAKGGYLFPGFIDVHVHGGGGADFMDGTAKAFETAAKAHLQFGTTTLVPTAMTATHEELIAFIEAYHEFKETSPYADIAYGLHLEGPYFSGADGKSKGAQKNDLIRPIDFDEVDTILKAAKGSIVRWDAAPELENSHKFARIMKENNIICGVAHTNATAEEAESGFNAGFSHVTHFYNAVTQYLKRGQVVTAGVVEATYLDENASVELICDGKHLPKHCMKLALKIKGEDKVVGITDATRIACTDLKTGRLGSLKDGTDVIVDDGVAKLPDLTSFAGSICTMQRALKVLCLEYGLTPVGAAKMLSSAPARHLRIYGEKGSVEVGKAADLVITDNDFNIQSVIKNGNVIK